jgi:tetratricopeptide (TPR) repeat protein
MSNINIFISAGTTANENQEKFVSAIESRLRSENLIPNTVGRNKFSADSPLKAVIELMDECYGTIIIALERTYFPTGTERRNGSKEKQLSEIKYCTSWNQIEAAMAYTKGRPILVIIEEGLKSEGLLEKGYDWYVMSVKPEVEALNSVEFNGVLTSWKKKVEAFAASQTEKQAAKEKLDPTLLTIGDLIKGLKPSNLWTILIALFALAGGSFAAGKYWVEFQQTTEQSDQALKPAQPNDTIKVLAPPKDVKPEHPAQTPIDKPDDNNKQKDPAVTEKEESIESLMKRADDLYDNDKYGAELIAILDQINTRQPDYYYASALSRTYLYLGNFSKTIEAATFAIGLQSNDNKYSAYYNRGLAYKKLGDVKNALSDFKTALECEERSSKKKQERINNATVQITELSNTP